jgi:hypothetical protein
VSSSALDYAQFLAKKQPTVPIVGFEPGPLETLPPGRKRRSHRKPVSAEWLRARYWDDGRDCVQIGDEVGRDPKTVWAWMRHYGIPTRPRGADKRQHFKPGTVSTFKGKHHDPETRALLSDQKRKSGHVPYLKNGVHHLKGKRGAATPNWKGGVTPERQAFYSSPEWRDAVKAVWARANAHCERCGAHHNGVLRGTFHVHHIVSFMVRELRSEPSNLALLCKTCHFWVHSRANVGREFIGAAP